MIFRESEPVLLRHPIFAIFQEGGSGPPVPSPCGSSHKNISNADWLEHLFCFLFLECNPSVIVLVIFTHILAKPK